MTPDTITLEEYLNSLPEERKQAMGKLRNVILKNLPEGFAEVVSSMLSYVVPYSIYPNGYHCRPKQPLPFINLASQKNFIAVYHFGVYADESLLKWFTDEYPNHSKLKLDMGKSCIRFKNSDQIPYELMGQLATKITPQRWIEIYEKVLQK